MSLGEALNKILIQGDAWKTILNGTLITIKISALSLLFGTILGAFICFLRMSRFGILRFISKVYIVILRGSPVLLLLMLLYYGVLAQTDLSGTSVAVITFSINVAASVAELLRTAIMATEHGQVEAALTLGFTKTQAFRLITLPQLVKVAKPVYQSTVVNLIQWTSVVGYVAITDLTRVINNTASRTMQPFITIVIGLLIYLALAYIVHGIFALTDLKKKGGEKA
ncbi:MAG: ABC transporter permease subunit [Lachnospiraceae bacterium]|nr:ABC transporter permease subunit [Lachnospiraceae bacterium]